ncbi:Nuclear valosin-containing protein-like [Aphelenchoides bicaudatus]|nr:Nuclear valosin-containing protein-like [Aphelenchoides bicaudatus]
MKNAVINETTSENNTTHSYLTTHFRCRTIEPRSARCRAINPRTARCRAIKTRTTRCRAIKTRGAPSSLTLTVTQPKIEIPKLRFADMGGVSEQFLEVLHLAMHMKRPEIHEQLNVQPPTGFLIHGPPGCGKTRFTEALSGELDLPLLSVSTTELISGVSGESEEKIRQLFLRARENAPCVLLLDEIDIIASRRENAQKEMERRIVTQLILCLDDLSKPIDLQAPQSVQDLTKCNDEGDVTIEPSSILRAGGVLVVGTSSRVENIDTALRRAGRFDKEIALGIPDERARIEILEIVCGKKMKLHPDICLKRLARLTPGYVGADLLALAREASISAVNRVFETLANFDHSSKRRMTAEETELEIQNVLKWLNSEGPIDQEKLQNLFIETTDFERALKIVSPSAKREGFATVPDVSWDDIGALKDVRAELEWSILHPIKRPEDFELLAIDTRSQGILLCGPPGCGKTLLAKAIANETGMNFISIKGPELLSMYVGESEKAVRTVFQRARDSSPCIIFFDEIDALCPRRNNSETSGSARLVNQMLTEMDGMEMRKQVFLIGATNRPDIVDPAILRPGRLDKVLFVDFPSEEDRADILRKTTKNGTRPKISSDVDFSAIANLSELELYTGADLAALVREAGILALRERLDTNNKSITATTLEHFKAASKRLTPSVGEEDRKRYAQLKKQYYRK